MEQKIVASDWMHERRTATIRNSETLQMRLALLFRHLSPRSHFQTESILGVCSAFTHPVLKFQFLPVIYNFGVWVAFLQGEEKLMRYWKFLALPTLIAALLS